MVSFVFLTKFILVKYHTSSLHTIQTLIQRVDRSVLVLYIPCKTAETSDLAIFAPSVAQSQKAALGSYLGRMYGTTSGFVIIIMTVIFSFLSSETERKRAGSREDSFFYQIRSLPFFSFAWFLASSPSAYFLVSFCFLSGSI